MGAGAVSSTATRSGREQRQAGSRRSPARLARARSSATIAERIAAERARRVWYTAAPSSPDRRMMSARSARSSRIPDRTPGVPRHPGGANQDHRDLAQLLGDPPERSSPRSPWPTPSPAGRPPRAQTLADYQIDVGRQGPQGELLAGLRGIRSDVVVGQKTQRSRRHHLRRPPGSTAADGPRSASPSRSGPPGTTGRTRRRGSSGRDSGAPASAAGPDHGWGPVPATRSDAGSPRARSDPGPAGPGTCTAERELQAALGVQGLASAEARSGIHGQEPPGQQRQP